MGRTVFCRDFEQWLKSIFSRGVIPSGAPWLSAKERLSWASGHAAVVLGGFFHILASVLAIFVFFFIFNPCFRREKDPTLSATTAGRVVPTARVPPLLCYRSCAREADGERKHTALPLLAARSHPFRRQSVETLIIPQATMKLQLCQFCATLIILVLSLIPSLK